MFIKRVIYSTYKAIKPINSKFKRNYIKLRYKHTINDLNLYKAEEYDEKGIYITVKITSLKKYKKRRKNQVFDKQGILLYEYRGEYKYNIIQIIQYGLEEYGYYIHNKDGIHLDNAKKIGNWIIDRFDREAYMWKVEFDYLNKNVGCNLKGPWCSALSQGQGISLLCRLYDIDKNYEYEEIVRLAIKLFKIPVEEGGILNNFNGFDIYEEYPTNPSSFTLNGFMYSLFGLYDAYKTFNLVEAKELFDIGINSLINILPFYDDSRMSYYDLAHITSPNRKPTQNSKYHIIHIKLLQGLMSIFPNETFEFYINRWKNIV